MKKLRDESFEKVHAQLRSKIRGYLARLVGTRHADDLTQEVFLKAARNWKKFRGASTRSTWIYKIATNTGLDWIRKKKTRAFQVAAEIRHSQGFVESPSDEESASRTVVKSEMWTCVRRLADKMPPIYRTVLILAEFEDKSDAEIAEILKISLQTAKMRLHRARAKLRSEIESHCGLYRDSRNKLSWDGRIK